MFFFQFLKRACFGTFIVALLSLKLVTLSSSKCLRKFNCRGGDFGIYLILEVIMVPPREVLGKLYHFRVGVNLIVPKSTG